MPSVGTSRSSSCVGNSGAPGSYTDAGPPESTSPFGFPSRIFSTGVEAGNSSAKTPHSRIRRAINCEYCPPKSRPSTPPSAPPGGGREGGTPSCVVAGGGGPPALTGPAGRSTSEPLVIRYGDSSRHRGPPVGAHPHRLLVLQLLPLAHQRRSHHHLGPLEGADVLVAAGGHRGFQRPHQVEGPVVLLGRPEEDLLERPVLLGRDAGAARQRRVEGRHPPVEAAAGRLLCPRQRRADHHRIGAAGDR